jgi:CelD/BcsL family acetyltransferase involved in cellulose biosynthesis
VTRVVPVHTPVRGWAELTAATGALFASPAWVGATTVLGAPVRLALARAGTDDDTPLLGLLPFVVQDVAGVPVVRFAGTGPSDYGTVPVTPGADRVAVVAALLDAVLADVTGDAADGRAQGDVVLDLQQVSELDPTAQAVRAWADARGRTVRERVQAETIRRTFGPDDGRESKNRRTKDRKTLKRLAALGAVEVCSDLLPDPVGADALVEELRAVDAAHPNADERNQPWTGTTGRLLAHHLRTAPPASRWLTGVRVDGRLVAYTLNLVAGNAVATYLCSYRREIADAGAGTLLLHEVRRRAFAHGAAALDLLRGLEPYKFRLATSTHVSHRLVVLPDGGTRWTLLGAALTWRQDLRPVVLRVRTWRDARRAQDRPTSAE